MQPLDRFSKPRLLRREAHLSEHSSRSGFLINLWGFGGRSTGFSLHFARNPSRFMMAFCAEFSWAETLFCLLARQSIGGSQGPPWVVCTVSWKSSQSWSFCRPRMIQLMNVWDERRRRRFGFASEGCSPKICYQGTISPLQS